MTAKNKDPHPFKVGDAALVRDVRSGKVVDNGVIHQTRPGMVVFKTTLPKEDGPAWLAKRELWTYRRKGVFWVEYGKDHFHLCVGTHAAYP